MARRRLIAITAAVGALALLVGGWTLGPRALRRVEFFRVRRVEFEGLRYRSRDDLVRALRLPAEASVFDPVEPLAARLTRLDGVDEVTVERRFPGTLRVVLKETEPVALVASKKGMQLMSGAGRRLPFDPALSAPDLPVALRPDSLVGRLLERVRDFDPGLFARVGTAWREGDHVVLETGGHRIRLRADASQEVIRSVTAVSEDLARRGR
ncbi:MAG: cell division protein FtsQ/DivIB, partial [Gemmatimonadota bacterium]